jgi:hypothetical protein
MMASWFSDHPARLPARAQGCALKQGAKLAATPRRNPGPALGFTPRPMVGRLQSQILPCW